MQAQGLRKTSVIRNGEMLGVSPGGGGSSATASVLGKARLEQLYNDGDDVRPTL